MKADIKDTVAECRRMLPRGWPESQMRHIHVLCDEVELLQAQRDALLTVLEELECSAYWSEYDVTVGIRGRIKAAIAKARG